MTPQELKNECDMLQGNINRMMVTESRAELYEMYYWASARLATLLRENRKKILAWEGAKELTDPFNTPKFGS